MTTDNVAVTAHALAISYADLVGKTSSAERHGSVQSTVDNNDVDSDADRHSDEGDRPQTLRRLHEAAQALRRIPVDGNPGYMSGGTPAVTVPKLEAKADPHPGAMLPKRSRARRNSDSDIHFTRAMEKPERDITIQCISIIIHNHMVAGTQVSIVATLHLVSFC
jgi:hypothetical protein